MKYLAKLRCSTFTQVGFIDLTDVFEVIFFIKIGVNKMVSDNLDSREGVASFSQGGKVLFQLDGSLCRCCN